MSGIDLNGQPPSDRDVDDAIAAITKAMTDVRSLLKLPPELAVNLPNIRRCLLYLKARRQ